MTNKQLYQDLYISKWIKIYRQKQENDRYCYCMEFALPFFYYVKITLAKPIRITIDKNKLERESNLLSRAAILRILSLFPRNESHSPEYISVLLKQKKYDLLNYMYNLAAFVSEDLKKYVDLHGFEEFCNGESIVAVNNKYCLIDRTGKQINTDSVTLKLPKILDRKEAIKLFRKMLRKYPIILDKI